jgi:hypothetical protein
MMTTKDEQGRDGGTNFILRIKEQEKHLTLHEQDDDEHNHLFVIANVKQLRTSRSFRILLPFF